MTDRGQIADGAGEDDAILAAEYVLRLLDEAGMRQAERRLADDPAFRREVARWQNDLTALGDDVASVAPPAGTKSAIERRLFPDASLPVGWRGYFSGRRGVLTGLLGVAALAVLAINLPGLLPTASPVLLAEMAAADRSLVLTARYDAGTLVVERTAGAVASGRVLELWLIVGAAAPVSLGVLPDERNAEIILPAELREAMSVGAVLAVSDEPPGGSPTGQPTGAVLAAGKVLSG